MNAGEIQERLSALQADGQAIHAALGGMEAAFTEWFAGMSGVHDLLARAAAQTDKGRRSLVTSGSSAPLESPTEKPIEKPPAKLATVVPALAPASIAPAPESAGPEPSAEEQDEKALLDLLDPDTARQVHVRRRLSGHSKSVRELIDDIRAEKGNKGGSPPADKQQQQQKKGWWN